MKRLASIVFVLGIVSSACKANYVLKTYAEKGTVECTLKACENGAWAQDLYQLPCCGKDKYLCHCCLRGMENCFKENLRNHKDNYYLAVQECKIGIITLLGLPYQYWKRIKISVVITCPFCRSYVFTECITAIPNKYRLNHCLRRVVWRKKRLEVKGDLL